MADWNLPSLSSTYASFRDALHARLIDAALWFDSVLTTPTNQPVGAKRINKATKNIEEWDGANWAPVFDKWGINISGNADTATSTFQLNGKSDTAFATAAQGTKADNALPASSQAVDSALLDGLPSTAFATSAQGTKADAALPATSQAADSAKLGGKLPEEYVLASDFILGRAEFMTAGSYNWTCPTGISLVFVTGAAGGGGGGAVPYNTSNRAASGGGGGGSCCKHPLGVTPGQSYTITVGGGGNGGLANGMVAPTAGGNSSIGSLFTLGGGGAGANAVGYPTQDPVTAPGGAAGGRPGVICSTKGDDGSASQASPLIPFTPAGGGGGQYGTGGTAKTSDGAGNDGTNYGAGGGGARSSANHGAYYNGGNGTAGFLIIEW